MPIQKFRSLTEARHALRIHAGTAEHSRALRAVFWMASHFAPPRKISPGVYKFRSIEEAQAHRKSWESP